MTPGSGQQRNTGQETQLNGMKGDPIVDGILTDAGDNYAGLSLVRPGGTTSTPGGGVLLPGQEHRRINPSAAMLNQSYSYLLVIVFLFYFSAWPDDLKLLSTLCFSVVLFFSIPTSCLILLHPKVDSTSPLYHLPSEY